MLLGLELGGTSCVAALSKLGDANIEILERAEFPTSASPRDTLDRVTQWMRARRQGVIAVGVASFGPVELRLEHPQYGCITSTPKPGWANFNVLQTVREALGLVEDFPVAWETDVNAPALVESHLGQEGPVCADLAYITVGTGVGVGLVVAGRAVHGASHPEAGHLLVPRHPEDTDFKGHCPFHSSCVEGFTRISAIAHRAGCETWELPGLPEEHPVWRLVAHYLACLCVNIRLTCCPQVIVLGGGVMNRRAILPLVQELYAELMNGYVQPVPRICLSSKFGSSVGIRGALYIAQLEHEKQSSN